MEPGIFNAFHQYLSQAFEQEGLARLKGEPEAIRSLRKDAFRIFSEGGLPSLKWEDWKYTPVSRFLNPDMRLLPRATPHRDMTRMAARAVVPGLDAYRIVLWNGKYLRELSDTLPLGIHFQETREAQANPLFTGHLGTLAQTRNKQQTLLAFNQAFSREMNFLHIPEGVTLIKPIHLIHLVGYEGQPSVIPFRNLVMAESGAEIQLLETFHPIHPETSSFISYTGEYWIGRKARLSLAQVNDLSVQAHFHQHMEVSQATASRWQHINISLPGSSFIRNDIRCRLQGTEAQASLWGLYLSGSRQLVDNHTVVDHLVPSCQSTEWYKGILQDQSHGVFNGKIFVEQDAQKTNAFQKNNNLLLSGEAQVHTKPQLEIFADDVKCSHGATVGQISEEALFYLTSRGISRESARQLLVIAFAQDIISKLGLEAIADHVRARLAENLSVAHLITA